MKKMQRSRKKANKTRVSQQPRSKFLAQEQVIGRRFDARATHYDNPVTAFIGEKELRVIRRMVPAGVEVLDYGCGTGRTALDHLQRGCKLTAYDVSPRMLEVAEAKAEGLGLKAEFTTNPAHLAGRRFPLVTCIGVLDYYPDPVPLLRELGAYLQLGGRLVVTCPNALSPLAWLYIAGSRFTVPAVAHSPRFMQQAAVRAGLKVTAMYYAFPEIAPIGHTLVIALHIDKRGKAIAARETVAAKMTAQQIAEAQALAAEWKPKGNRGELLGWFDTLDRPPRKTPRVARSRYETEYPRLPLYETKSSCIA